MVNRERTRRDFFRAAGTALLPFVPIPIDQNSELDERQVTSVSVPHNRLLTSILHLMGRTDIERVGDPNGGQTLDNSPLNQLCAGGA